MHALTMGSDSNTLVAAVDGSETVAIPDNSSGRVARRCYIAVTQEMFFLLAADDGSGPVSVSGASAVTVVIGVLLRPEHPLVISTNGFTDVFVKDVTGGGTFQITPLEV